MKFNYKGSVKVIPASHALHPVLVELDTDSKRAGLYSTYERLNDELVTWNKDYKASNRKVFNVKLGIRANNLVNSFEVMSPNWSKRERSHLGVLVNYEKTSRGWKGFGESYSAVLQYWAERDVDGDKGLNFDEFAMLTKLQFIDALEPIGEFFSRLNLEQTGKMINFATCTEYEKGFLGNFLRLKSNIEAYFAAVHGASPKLTEIHCDDPTLACKNLNKSRKKQLSMACPTSVTDKASFSRYNLWLINYFWSPVNSQRYFAFCAWLENNPQKNRFKSVEDLNKGIGYVTHNKRHYHIGAVNFVGTEFGGVSLPPDIESILEVLETPSENCWDNEYDPTDSRKLLMKLYPALYPAVDTVVPVGVVEAVKVVEALEVPLMVAPALEAHEEEEEKGEEGPHEHTYLYDASEYPAVETPESFEYIEEYDASDEDEDEGEDSEEVDEDDDDCDGGYYGDDDEEEKELSDYDDSASWGDDDGSDETNPPTFSEAECRADKRYVNYSTEEYSEETEYLLPGYFNQTSYNPELEDRLTFIKRYNREKASCYM